MITAEEIKEAQRQWGTAVVSGDPDRVMELYAPNAILKPTLSPVIRDSKPGIRAYFEGSKEFEDHGFLAGNRWAEVLFHNLCDPLVNGDFAIDVGKYTFVQRDGQKVVADYTFTYARIDDELRILSQHSSLEYTPQET